MVRCEGEPTGEVYSPGLGKEVALSKLRLYSQFDLPRTGPPKLADGETYHGEPYGSLEA